uniref:Uncharacterized protein n=1 Tax=Odontella aurita TaxID=265563 RepID=A0A7S4JZ33_9STRA|mmetsp:Transcript_5750/g.16582  ORF Transcript_5750/g.16582 Transcript_5750/m.16582 type:complete len:158 (+) Transcript_5750:2-475(+)
MALHPMPCSLKDKLKDDLVSGLVRRDHQAELQELSNINMRGQEMSLHDKAEKEGQLQDPSLHPSLAATVSSLQRSPGGTWRDSTTGKAVELAVSGNGKRGRRRPSQSDMAPREDGVTASGPTVAGESKAEEPVVAPLAVTAVTLPPPERRQSLPRSA